MGAGFGHQVFCFHLYDVGAVNGAATKLKEKILVLAAHLLRSTTERLEMADGMVKDTTTGETIGFSELAKVAYTNQARLPKGFEPGLQATYYHSFPHADPMMLPDAQGRVRAQTRAVAGKRRPQRFRAQAGQHRPRAPYY